MLTIQCFNYICSGVFEAREIDISSNSKGSKIKDYISDIKDEREEDSILDKALDLLTYLVLF